MGKEPQVFFSVMFGWSNKIIVKKFSVLLHWPFPPHGATDSRLFFFFFFGGGGGELRDGAFLSC